MHLCFLALVKVCKVVCLFPAFIDNISFSIIQQSNSDAKRGKNRCATDPVALIQKMSVSKKSNKNRAFVRLSQISR